MMADNNKEVKLRVLGIRMTLMAFYNLKYMCLRGMNSDRGRCKNIVHPEGLQYVMALIKSYFIFAR